MNRLVPIFFLIFGPMAMGAEPTKDPSTGKISYFKEIRPILQQHCQGCHQPAKAMGGYNMTSYPDMLKKGDRDRPGIVPHKPKESFLVELIHPKDGKAEMPRNREPLTEPQIKLITNWVAQGAIDDSPPLANAPLVDQEHPPTYKALPVVTALAFSPDSQILAVSGYHEVLLHKGDGSEIIGRLVGLSERIQSLAFSPDGKWLAVSGGDPGRFGEIQIWNLDKQKLKLSIPVSFDTVYGVSWSPDGTKVACGCGDNTIRAFDVNEGKQVLYQGAHGDWVMGTSFSIDGGYLVSVSRDRTVKLTDFSTQRFIDNVTSITPGVLKGGLTALEVRPMKEQKKVKRDEASGGGEFIYNELLTAGSDGVPRLYKMHRTTKRIIGDDANRIREFEKLPGRIYSVAFSKDGKLFAAGSSLDGTGEARVYEVDSGKRISQFESVSTPVYAVAFRPDGKVVASGGFDGIVRLNDPSTGKLIKGFASAPRPK